MRNREIYTNHKEEIIRIAFFAIKFLALAVICSFLKEIYELCDPIIKNSLAMMQMGNGAYSSSALQSYQNLSQWIMATKVLMAVILFANDVVYFIRKIKEKRNEENY